MKKTDIRRGGRPIGPTTPRLVPPGSGMAEEVEDILFAPSAPQRPDIPADRQDSDGDTQTNQG
ncbi:MAG: hypothetical protein N2111_14075 [Candidatus Sumerlaeaceae bacterium]|nr:hypothetical protein [Candidatus Sumerlaeaceae bacterium]